MDSLGVKKSRKDRILDAALRIFAEKGFQETTISEISKEAGVSEATIYEHFGTKEDLLFAIPPKITDERIAEMERMLPFFKGSEAKLRALLRGFIDLYENTPDYSALLLLQLVPNKRFRQTESYVSVRRAPHILMDVIKDGIKDGTFKKDSNARLIHSMLLGTIENLFIRWHLKGAPRNKETIMDLLDPILDIVLNGSRARNNEEDLTIRLHVEGALKGLIVPEKNVKRKKG